MKILATNRNLNLKTKAQRNTGDVIRTILGLIGSLLIALNWVPAEQWAELTGAADVLIETYPVVAGAILTIWGVISSIFNKEVEEVEQQLASIR